MLIRGGKTICRHSTRCLDQIFRRLDPVDQPPGIGLGCLDLLATHQDHLCPCRSDQRFKSRRIGGLRQKAELHHGIKELGLRHRKPDVASQNDAERAPGKRAVQSGNRQTRHRRHQRRQLIPQTRGRQTGPRLIQIRAR